jgi:hypothetical protein
MFYFKDYLPWGPLSTEESFTLEVSDNDFNSGQPTVEPGYNDIGLCDTSPITSGILWYQSIPRS